MNKFINFMFVLLGTIFLTIGVVGAFLPVLPTTPLIMLACFCYSKGSKKIHNILVNSKIYQKYAKNFVENKELSLKRKLVLLCFASIMLFFPLIILKKNFKILIVITYIYLYYYFLFKIKTK